MIPRIEVWLTETQMADDFVQSLKNRRLDERFFYWLPLSVRAWIALCSDGEYRNYIRSRSLISNSADDIAGFATDAAEVVSLGSGQGDKDLFVLDSLKRSGTAPSYTPVDSSQALLEMACSTALTAGFETKGIKSDLLDPGMVASLTASRTGRRLLMMLGNTMGAFDPQRVAATVAAMLNPGELWLVDGELYSGKETMAGYDNPINRRFAWGPLNSIGLDESHGEIMFEDGSDSHGQSLHKVEKYFIARTGLAMSVGGEELKMEEGEKISMNHSIKYTHDSFIGILAANGLRAVWEGISDDGHFIMALVEKEPP